MGNEVTFITTGLSLFSVLRKDARLKTGRPLRKLWEEGPGLYSFLHFTLLHPHTLIIPVLDRLSGGMVRKYADCSLGQAEAKLKEAELIVYESCSAVCLLPRMRQIAPQAKHIYRASDILSAMRSLHPEVKQIEREIIPLFDLISVPKESMMKCFAGHPRVFTHAHGIDTAAYDAQTVNPYPPEPGRKHCVFVGMSHLDYEFLQTAARAFPEVLFHIIGPLAQNALGENIIYYGRMEYHDTLKYIKFADVGLYTRMADPDLLSTLGCSLKMQQYRYCQLPVVVSDKIDTPPPDDQFFRYQYGNPESMKRALQDALAANHNPAWKDGCHDWQKTASAILDDLQ